MTSSLALSPALSGQDGASGRGSWSDRVRPNAKHSVEEREVLGVDGEQKRGRESGTLETEATVDPAALEEFAKKNPQVERGSTTWKLIFDEFVMERLRDRDMDGYMRQLRLRGLSAPMEEEQDESAPVPGSGGRGVVEEDEAEGRGVKTPTSPYVPTAKERKEHNATHYPHRSWCEICMSGRAIAGKHVKSADEVDPRAGELHFDYCFLKNKVKEEPAVTLVGVDKASDAVLAHVVPEKGTQFEWVATQLERDVRKLGYHGRVVIKSDGENSAKELMSELAKKRKDMPTVIETSKPYDSKSNGRAEGAVRKLECQVRVLKIATEKNFGVILDVHSPMFSWLVEHAADVLTKCSLGADGRTPYERIKQKKYHGVMVEFGSMVMVKLQGKLQGGIMKERWIPGLWLGKRWTTDEHLISVASGRVVRARDVRLFPEDKLFDLE